MSENQASLVFTSEEYNVRLTRDFGAVKLELTFTTYVTVSSPEQRSRVFARIAGFMNDAVNDFARDNLNNLPVAGGADNVMIVQGGKLTLEISGGKRRVNLRVGQWQQFGVPIYPEVFEQSGLTYDEIHLEHGYDMSGWRCAIEMRDGRPVKVSRMQRV